MNQHTGPMQRLFLALWPDDDTRNALSALQAGARGRLVPYADLHLTLVFLGQQPLASLPDLTDVLAHLPRGEIEMRLDKVGYFTRNRILWAGSHSLPPALPELHKFMMDALAERGVAWKEDGREYSPHITLARDADAPMDLVFEPFVWRARHVALVRSNSQPQGSRYEVIASRMLDEDVRLPDPG
ncbi:MAG TPA: RNA 2',3'-cyclic phosphodiesterase [Noviherbaspirillum sp.]|nr:RNA 2',3'-cyclic phosphodiesterase [Noviherbaspirillum sp.]